jgi:hypothetical protein
LSSGVLAILLPYFLLNISIFPQYFATREVSGTRFSRHVLQRVLVIIHRINQDALKYGVL